VAAVLDSPTIDHAALAAVEGLRARGSRCRAYVPAGGANVWVDAVHAGGVGWSGYSKAACRRAAIGGPRMLPVLGSGDVAGRFWIAYDTGSATSLAEHRSRGPLPTLTVLQVLSDVAEALDGAAAVGVFASELPPDSVFLTGKGARLGDLGTAREGLAGTKLQLEGVSAYVPAEVLRGRGTCERSGVYLYGALLHYLLTGAPPARGLAAPTAGGHSDLPASLSAIVAAATADEPETRPASVSEAHEMARRALRGEPPARVRRPRRTSEAAAATMRKPVRTARRTSEAAAAARLPVPWRGAAAAVTPRRAVAVGFALVLGAAAGLLLGGPPESEPARARTVTAGGLSMTLPSGRHRVDAGVPGLSVRAPGSHLRARFVDRSLPPRPPAEPVQLGALQAWRSAAGGVVRYSIPTSRSTLVVTCRMTASGGPRPLRLCERTASTIRLRQATALPLAAAAEESRGVRSAIAALKAERDAARARLAGAPTPSDQRAVAEELADSHERAATALRELAGAEAIEIAARDVADAYSKLAASAQSGSAGRWNEASDDVRRSDALLAEAIATAG
jgi:hypothetical protein